MYKMTEEHRKKIGEANKRGKIIECVICMENFYISPYQEKRNYPKRCCSKKCFRIRFKNNFAMRGDGNRFWKNGGWSFVKRHTLERDNYTCRMCGFSDKEIMEVDHIKERVLGGTDSMDNTQTLCPNCHAKKTNKFLRERNKQEYAGK